MSELTIVDMCISFKKKQILNNINLHCESGNIYGVVGYNGAGKSVLFKCICGFLQYDTGDIIINGNRLHKDIDIPESIGFIIEEPGYIKNRCAYDNLEFLYCIKNKKNRKKIMNILEMVGLDPRDKKKVEKFSLGMKQRLAIAQAIMEDPDILILDEPMNGLDKNGVQEMRKLFEQMKSEGKLILLASHNREDIDILCDEVFEIENGVLRKLR